MAKKKRRRGASTPELARPPAERYQHDLVELLDHAIADEDGRAARPYRSVDILAAMERREAITADMRQAGEDFRIRFRAALLDPLKASRLEYHTPSHGDGPGLRIKIARDNVWAALGAVGGVDRPGGSCLWHVVGCETSLKEWATERAHISQETASGVLIGSLGMLAAHYAGRTSRQRPGHHALVERSF